MLLLATISVSKWFIGDYFEAKNFMVDFVF